jgi:hypothetical protein
MSTATAAASTPEQKGRVEILGLAKITIDYAIQSRVKMDIEAMRDYSALMAEGATFPPVEVFWDGQKYWLANGFHRHGAVKSLGRQTIKARVYQGTREDAMIYSAGDVKRGDIARSREDKKKACEMLFALPEWWARADAWIGSHVGLTNAQVNKYRRRYSQTTKTPLPEKVLRTDKTWTNFVHRQNGSRAIVRSSGGRKGKQITFHASVRGKKVYGKTEEAAKEKLDALLGACDSRITCFSDFLLRLGIANQSKDFRSFACNDAFLVAAKFHESPNVFDAVGRALMARHAYGKPTDRAVIVGYKVNCLASHIEIAESMGIEFLTPDEFIESLKPSAPHKENAPNA